MLIRQRVVAIFILVFCSCFVPIAFAYLSHDKCFEIGQPHNWQVNESPYGEKGVSFNAPVGENAFEVNIRIEWRDAGGIPHVRDKDRQDMKEAILTGFKNGRILREGDRTINKIPAYEMIAQINRGGLDLKVGIVVFIAEGIVYSIAYTATPDQYNQFLRDFEKCLNTFKALR